MIFAIVLNVTAGLGAFLMGFLDDVIGGKKTIQISNIGLIVACIIAVLSPHKDLFVLSIPLIGDVMITGKIMFWISGVLIGTFSGPNQAASRSLMARFVPIDKTNEFFGFFAFSGKITAFLGPFLLAQITYISFKYFHLSEATAQRLGVSVVLLLLLVGSSVLHFVDEKEAVE